METYCEKCVKKGDCWIKAVLNGKRGITMMDLNESEQRMVIRASNHDCDCYMDDYDEGLYLQDKAIEDSERALDDYLSTME